jgi:hypothetical protein
VNGAIKERIKITEIETYAIIPHGFLGKYIISKLERRSRLENLLRQRNQLSPT